MVARKWASWSTEMPRWPAASEPTVHVLELLVRLFVVLCLADGLSRRDGVERLGDDLHPVGRQAPDACVDQR